MPGRVRKRAIKIKKKMKQQATPATIEKRPISPLERRKKLRKDLLRIARRYEEMRLYDDAIGYYKKLGKDDDVERLNNIKQEIYVEKAREFEAQEKYEDALRLYENLKMTAEVERLNRLLGKDNILDTGVEKTAEAVEPEFTEEAEAEPEVELPSENGEVEDELLDETVMDESKPPEKLEYFDSPEPESIPAEPPSSAKIFKICPYCGEELNLPKKPNFCPYCTEALV